MFLLFDCNNFFASCEQVFRPDWRRRPLVVLSNNDGCVVARSKEAKALGIAMGEPYFRCRERLEQAHAVVCSGNFSLYQDLSDRVMSILEEALPEVHQYSIDEAFARVEGKDGGVWLAQSRRLRSRIYRWTGLTVSVGLAPTRTLAKLANELAKKETVRRGVCALFSAGDWEPVLDAAPVEDVWGVGRRLAPRLRAVGIRTAAGLARSNLGWLRQQFGVHGERLALELRGVSCLEDEAVARQQIMVSRSLKEGISDFSALRGILCRFVEKAARHLREEGLLAQEVQVVLRTSRYEQGTRLYADACRRSLPYPTDDTRDLTRAAVEMLDQIFCPGYPFRKVGVLLTSLCTPDEVQPLLGQTEVHSPSKLMNVLDALQKQGHHIHFGNIADKPAWRRSFVSPSYTTNWADLPEVH